jgi:hypothetical protein
MTASTRYSPKRPDYLLTFAGVKSIAPVQELEYKKQSSLMDRDGSSDCAQYPYVINVATALSYLVANFFFSVKAESDRAVHNMAALYMQGFCIF